MHRNTFKLFEKMFNMSSIVLNNSFNTLSSFIDTPANRCLQQSVPLSPQSKFQLVDLTFSWTGVLNKLYAEVHPRWRSLLG